MNIEIEEIDACNKKIKFDIPHQEYQTKIKNYYKTLGRDVKVPGFRKGKVPQSLLEKQFGPRVKQEVLTQLISDHVMEAIQEKGLRAVSQPNLLEVHAEEGTDINVSASVEVLPEFELADHADVEIDVKVAKVTEDEVDQVLKGYQTNKAKNIQVTDRVSQKEDFLKIDFTGTLNGKPFEGGEAKDYIIQLGTKQLIEDLEKNLYGMSLNETKDAKVQIPEDYFNKPIAGKEVDFSITLKGIQVKELPELNDEFAQTVDPDRKYENLADMKEQIREDLENHEKKQARKGAQKQLADKLTDLNPVNLPEGLILEQIRLMAAEAEKKKNPQTAQGHTHDHDHDHGHEEGKDAQVSQEDQEKFREPALKILQQELVVDKLATQLKIDVSQDELDREVNNFIQMLGGGDIEKTKRDWQKSGLLAKLHSRMRKEKTLEAVLDQVKVREEMVDRKELIADN
ncbi:MAG: trigger factor [Nitrospinaceae bacterium]|nr:MAG: trigger factor [Nitrospinaceae bacterium]